MKYKGIDLVEITASQIFDPPKEMLVWNNNSQTEPKKVNICAIVKLKDCYAAIETGKPSCYLWHHCAEIPEEPKPRRVTNRELSKWLAKGHGEYINQVDCANYTYTYDDLSQVNCASNTYTYDGISGGKNEVPSYVKVRKWDDVDWHEPTVDYMGIE